MNIILMSDSYKFSHPWQYPKGTTYMHDYLESRGGTSTNWLLPVTKFFGLQYYVKRYLTQKITVEMIDEAEEVLRLHGVPFYREGWEKVVAKHDGYLPLKIRAVKEGTIVERRNVLMTVESTDPELYWIVSWAETLLMKVWYPTTVATLSYNIYLLMESFLEKTADTLDKLPFMLHDFGYRGASSDESASIGGVANLSNFSGTDTVGALVYGRKYYNTEMPGFSIPASEHSTVTSWGVGSENEKKAFRNMITQFGDRPMYSVVSDSWDFDNALDTWGELEGEVKSHEGILIVRPDSGDAKYNILLALRKLEKYYGAEVNMKGYKVLNHVRLLQGDGVDFDTIYDILKIMMENGYSADNIAFGMGGALLQGTKTSSMNRDTHKFAIKCSAIMLNGELRDVFKDPITDKGKTSKKGRLDLIYNREMQMHETIVLDPEIYGYDGYHPESVLELYYENGVAYCDYSLEDMKNRI